ncbi:MAG TPA: YciI family protein [Acidobacteriaceae bacterium]|nr:YciI family protein [Acidobacteriaceae bacterium]
MQFLMFYTPSSSRPAGPPSQEYMDEMNRLIEASMKSGELLATGGLTPLQAGARVTQATGKVTITDGPFIESTEIIGGFALFELPSKEAAIESSKNFLKVAGDGHVTIRPLMNPSDVCTGEETLVTQSAQ